MRPRTVALACVCGTVNGARPEAATPKRVGPTGFTRGVRAYQRYRLGPFSSSPGAASGSQFAHNLGQVRFALKADAGKFWQDHMAFLDVHAVGEA